MACDSLDTNTIVHFILGDIPEQAEKVDALLNSPDTLHKIFDLAISESVYIFEKIYKMDRKRIVAALDSFLKCYDEVLDYNRELFELVFPYYESHPVLSFNDCCLAFLAELECAEPLFTFDNRLAKQHPSAKLV